jgi:hypothetical protein
MRAGLAIALGLVACHGHGDKNHSSAGVGSGSAVVGSASAAVGSASAASLGSAEGSGSGSDLETLGAPATVTLDKPGAQPRHTFAYSPHAADRIAKLTFTMGQRAADGEDIQAMAVAVTFAWHTPADASHAYELAVKESRGLPPADAKGGEEKIMGAVGAMYSAITLRVEADAQGRGRVIRTSSTLPTQPKLSWLLHPMIVAVPKEPIGVGATWQVKEPLSMDQMQGEMTRTYQVTAMQGDTLTLKVSGGTHWTMNGGSADDALEEHLDGTMVVGASDVLAISADLVDTQDLGPLQPRLHLQLGPGSPAAAGP